MTDGFSGTRYDLIKSLDEDVDLLLKRVADLVRTQKVCSRDIENLSQTTSEMTTLMNDTRTLVSKEALQRLYSQLSSEAAAEIGALTRQLRDDVATDFDRKVTTQIQGVTTKLAELQKVVEEIYQELNGKVDNNELDQYFLKEEGLALSRNCVTQHDLEAVNERLEATASQEQLGMLRNEVVDHRQFTEANERASTQYAELGAVTTQLDEKICALGDKFSTYLVAAATAVPEMIAPPTPDTSELDAAIATAVETATIASRDTATLRAELGDYLLKKDALAEQDIRSLLGLWMSKQEFQKERESLVEKDNAVTQFLTRSEFDALKSIIVTRSDLQTLGKNELDELRGEQEMLKRSVPTRDHLNLLRVECEALREQCSILESKLERVEKRGAVVVEAVAPATQSRLITIEGKEAITFHYVTIAPCHMLMSKGFSLLTAETTFLLPEIAAPQEAIDVSSGKGYTSILYPDRRLVFTRVGDDDIEVRRFLFWW